MAYDFEFIALDSMHGDPAWQEDPWPEVLSFIQQYNPEREIVFVTTASRDGRDPRQMLQISLLQPPRGGMSPPEAAGQRQPRRERQEKGLDPDAV